MTTRSNASSSATHARLGGGGLMPREDSDVYMYALRVAVLHWAIRYSNSSSSSTGGGDGSTSGTGAVSATPGGRGGTGTVAAAALARPSAEVNGSATARDKDKDAGWKDALLSLGDVFSSSSSSSSSTGKVKFPKEFPKILEQRMVAISQGTDRAHQDSIFRACVGAFYGTYTSKPFQTKLSQNRKIEELILMFVTTASGVVRKRVGTGTTTTTAVDGEWQPVLNAQVGEFVIVVRDALRAIRSTSPELLQRLESYCAKLAPPKTASNTTRHSITPSVATSSSARDREPSPTPSTSKHTLDGPPPPGAPASAAAMSSTSVTTLRATNLQDMPLAQAVGRMFGKSEPELVRDIVTLRRHCTEQAAFHDLKTCINLVAQAGGAGVPPSGSSRFPARREDFDSDDAFAAWRKQEADQLQELLLEMIKRSPDLVNSAPPSEVASASSASTLTAAAVLAANLNGHGPGNRSSLAVSLQPSASPNGSILAPSSSSFDDDLAAGGVDTSLFTFVPPDPKFYFKRLYEVALDYDYDAMKDLPPDEDVSLSILSPVHEELLNECATRWRVMATLRCGTFLALIGQHYKMQGVPEACVAEALRGVERVADEWEYWRWPWADRQYLFKNMSVLFDNLLSRFFEIFQGILELPFDEVVDLLEAIYAHEIFREDVRDLQLTFQELQHGMRKFVAMAYEEKQIEVDSTERPHDLFPFLVMLDWITAEAKVYDQQFPRKLMESIDVPAIFLSIAGPWFVQHLDASRAALLAAASQAEGAAGDADLLDLYRGTISLQKMHNAFCPEDPLVIDFSAWFEPFVRRWLATTDTKTQTWVQAAIQHDKFEPEGSDSHSSSIIDLIDSCKSATDFVLKLDWPDEYENAKYLTALSKTIAKSIEQYANRLEAMFVEEMFPRKSPQQAIDKDVARPSAWLTKAKLAVQGDRKVEPFVFRAESCVKLNNIQAARKLLDTMYTTLDADKVSKIVELNAPPQPVQSAGPPRYLFTVKIMLAENLIPPEGSSRGKKLDPFLILSDPAGFRVAKTRTLYETNDPRWDETIDVSVKGDLWLRATVYNRNLVDHHDNVGCAYIHLDPRKFSDFLAKDMWFQLEDTHRKPLDTRLSLRISMEGEKDDIQFYFGRAFRSLKRAENDMVRIMVDKMSPFVRHYISHSTLKTLVKTSYNFDIDLDKVRGDLGKVSSKVNAYVRDAISGPNYTIPPVHDELSSSTSAPMSPAMEKKGRGPLTDLEIEDAIGDLFDYFNATFGTLKENLSQAAWDLVIGRLWKEILTTIEGLIVPPMSDRPTDMKLLSEKEVDIVFKWLGFLVNFFHGQGDGVPLEDLRNAKYRELVEARMYYDWSTDQLMEESVRTMQRQMLNKSDSILGRSKSVYQQRNLGTIRARKIEKKQTTTTSGEMILRILRMHPGTADFLSQQLMTMQSLQAEQARKQAQRGNVGSLQRRPNGGLRGGGGRNSYTRGPGRASVGDAPPPLPPLPEP